MIAARSSSASLPRSPESDLQAMIQVAGGSSGSGQGSLGSHGSNQEVYVNIYQNTNHPSLFVSCFHLTLTNLSMHFVFQAIFKAALELARSFLGISFVLSLLLCCLPFIEKFSQILSKIYAS